MLVTGGEGEMAREKEGVEAHLLVASGRVGMADGRVIGDEQNAAAEAHDGEGAPVTDWQRKEAEELHGVEAKLARGSWRLGKVGSGGFAVEQSSPGRKIGGGGCMPARGLIWAFYRSNREWMSER